VVEDRRHILHRVQQVVVGEQRHRLRLWNLDKRDGRFRDRREVPFAAGHEPTEVDDARLAVLAAVLGEQAVEVSRRRSASSPGKRSSRARLLVEDPDDLGVDPR